MIEDKRFIYVIDNGEPIFYDLNSDREIMSLYETEDMLNELNVENEMLNHALNISRLRNAQKVNEVIDLQEEISELKQAVFYFLDLAMGTTSSACMADIWCQKFLNCNYEEAKKKYKVGFK